MQMYQCSDFGSVGSVCLWAYGSNSGSVNHRYGSEDPVSHPDPYQNVTCRTVTTLHYGANVQYWVELHNIWHSEIAWMYCIVLTCMPETENFWDFFLSLCYWCSAAVFLLRNANSDQASHKPAFTKSCRYLRGKGLQIPRSVLFFLFSLEGRSLIQIIIRNTVSSSVPDPDPRVFGPPGSGSISQSYGSWYGSFHHQAKIVRKTLIPTQYCFVASFGVLSSKMM